VDVSWCSRPARRILVRVGKADRKEEAVSKEENKQIIRRYFEEVLNGGKVDVLDDLAAEDYHEHNPFPGQGTGRGWLKERARTLGKALSSHLTMDEIVAEGDTVVVRWTNEGTQVGEFYGIPATGKSFKHSGVGFYRIDDGRMAEHVEVVDMLSLLQQLGTIPAPQGTGG
jgi:steroid delta-isomerase-like uncharacterized protein